jgi:hypothetical protein
MMRIKVVASLFALLSVLLSNTAMAYATSPTGAEPSPPFLVILEDDTLGTAGGCLYGLNVYGPLYACILYGIHYDPYVAGGLMWPIYGFLFGNEMVLWVDGTGIGSAADSVAYVGEWDFGKLLFTGTWVNIHIDINQSWAGDVKMWPWGMKPTAETGSEASPSTIQTEGAYCLKDSFGCTWDLDLFFNMVFVGTVNCHGQIFPALGYKIGNEMFLWGNTPASVYDFVYIGNYDGAQQKYIGAWTYYPGPGHGRVSWWFC